MEWLLLILDFIVKSLLQEFIVVVSGVLVALFIQSSWEKWRYGNWNVILKKEGREILQRSISPGKVKEILAEPAELSVFLKGVASPYEWINCDLLEDGKSLGLLVADRKQRRFILDLDKNPVKGSSGKVSEAAALKSDEPMLSESREKRPLLLINFGHPLSETQQEDIATLLGRPIGEIRPVKTQFDSNQPFAEQVKNLADQVGLSAEDWQTRLILINPPALQGIALTLLAELHGRMGYFPTILRLKPVPDTTPPQFEVAEMINLQAVRDSARLLR